MLKVNEIFHSIQGEGSRSGQAMTFIRLSGCNLRCPFCDTKRAYDDGIEMDERDILTRCVESPIPWVCLTGGEPLLQNAGSLVELLHGRGFLVALETNGTLEIPPIFDHIVVSPKRNQEIHVTAISQADEWKYIIQDDSDFDRIDYETDVWLQPVDNDMEIAKRCVQKILENPGWRLSLQVHKLIGIR